MAGRNGAHITKARRSAVGKEIKRARLAAKMSKAELARQIGCGDYRYVIRWERGLNLPGPAYVTKLEGALPGLKVYGAVGA